MSNLLDNPPFAKRDQEQFLRELTELTRFQLEGCEEYRRMWPDWKCTEDVSQFPFIHVGVFKRITLRTSSATIKTGRVLRSSATTSGVSSQIVLDQKSSELQSRSCAAILADFLGWQQRPLVVLDSAIGLRATGGLSARIAGAMSLRPLASDVMFLLRDTNDPNSMKWGDIQRILDQGDELLVYGFTYMLWLAWAKNEIPGRIRDILKTKRISFVHSGGWKKLEAIKVSREEFDTMLLATGGQGSKVIDFYGLVEQIGIVYPMCEHGYRHVPLWADTLVRDSITLDSLINKPGQLQLVNTISWGAPYHNVLTEDIAMIVPGKCQCGRHGKRFELLGRIPKVEIRGCANV
jgi:hypothetical protein